MILIGGDRHVQPVSPYKGGVDGAFHLQMAGTMKSSTREWELAKALRINLYAGGGVGGFQ